MEERFLRNIFYYKRYYLDFFKTLNTDVKRKFNWTLKLIATLERVPIKYFKNVKGSTGIYEIRVEAGSNIFRVFYFFDRGKLVVLINGFQKKSQKIPKKEIVMAEKLKKQYFDEKDKK
jgi:phage-related protein